LPRHSSANTAKPIDGKAYWTAQRLFLIQSFASKIEKVDALSSKPCQIPRKVQRQIAHCEIPKEAKCIRLKV
jgi:hypothetical protein